MLDDPEFDDLMAALETIDELGEIIHALGPEESLPIQAA